MAVDDNDTTTAGEPVVDVPAQSEVLDCRACATQFPPAKLIQLRCDDRYCHSCLQRLFEMAMKDETLYPPRCHGIPIPIKTVKRHLPRSLLRKFQEMKPELSCRDKTYCHLPTCSTFIAPHSIHNEQAICQKCRAVTCNNCRKAWHFGPCIEDQAEDFFKLLRSTHWKRCPECRRVVEKTDGCNHVVCR